MPGVRWAGAHRVRQARQSEDWQREMAALRAHWAPSAAAAGSGPAAATAAGSPERDAAGSGASAATGAGSSVEFEWELHQEALRAWEDAKQQARTDRERAFQAATRRWEAQQAGSRAAREGASRDGVRLPDLPGRASKDPAGLYGALGLEPGADPPPGRAQAGVQGRGQGQAPRPCLLPRRGGGLPRALPGGAGRRRRRDATRDRGLPRPRRPRRYQRRFD